jgi:hypothetical protein
MGPRTYLGLGLVLLALSGCGADGQEDIDPTPVKPGGVSAAISVACADHGGILTFEARTHSGYTSDFIVVCRDREGGFGPNVVVVVDNDDE